MSIRLWSSSDGCSKRGLILLMSEASRRVPDTNRFLRMKKCAGWCPFIERARAESDALISIDTSKAAVAEAALEAGADIVNDVWGAQRDPEMAAAIGRHEAACILMHNRPAEEAGEGDVVEAIRSFLEVSVAKVKAAGVCEDAIMLDPGLGFGKTYEENWEIMRRLPEINGPGLSGFVGRIAQIDDREATGLKRPQGALEWHAGHDGACGSGRNRFYPCARCSRKPRMRRCA